MKVKCAKCGKIFESVDEAVHHIPLCPKKKPTHEELRDRHPERFF